MPEISQRDHEKAVAIPSMTTHSELTDDERRDHRATTKRRATRESDVWAQALPALVRYVARRGLITADAQDIAQDVALRAVRDGIEYADVEDLLRWCQVVAKRVVIDQHRKSERTQIDLIEEELADPRCLTDRVHDQIQLEATMRVVAGLPIRERDAVLDVINDADGSDCRADQLRQAAARLRARSRLRRAVGYPWAVVFGAVGVGRALRPTRAAAGAAPLIVTASFALTFAQSGPIPTSTAATPQVEPLVVPALAHQSTVRWHWGSRNASSAYSYRTAGVRTSADQTNRTVAVIHGPAGASNRLSSRPRHPEDHVICVSGDLTARPVCIG